MKIEQFKNIIQRYLDGKLSEEEKKGVDGWYEEIASEKIDPFTDKQHKSRVKQSILESLPADMQSDQKQVRTIRLRWVSVAAALLLCGVSALLIQHNKQIFGFNVSPDEEFLTELSTRPGERREFLLPDHSSIFLNGNTQIRYDEKQYLKDRKIYLDKGEAFFSVQRDSLHPFSVDIGSLNITVLGTSFNINHAKQSKISSVDVKTGRVRVSSKLNKVLHILTAGQGLKYEQELGTYTCYDTDPNHANLWTQGGILLADATFQELHELIYNRYGLSLRSENLDTSTFKYSLSLPQVKSVDQLLNMICTIHQNKFRREGNEIILHQ